MHSSSSSTSSDHHRRTSKPFARIWRWSAEVNRSRGADDGGTDTLESHSPVQPVEDTEGDWEERGRSGEVRTRDDGSVAAYPRPPPPQRPPLSRAQTWAHKIRPIARPSAQPAPATAPLPSVPPHESSTRDTQAPPKLRHRLPTLGSMPPIPKFSFPSASSSSKRPSQPSSPAAEFRPFSSSTHQTHSRRGSSPYTPDETALSSRNLTPHAGTASLHHNPFFPPVSYTASTDYRTSSSHSHTTTSRFSRHSSTPTTTHPEPLSPIVVAKEGESSPTPLNSRTLASPPRSPVEAGGGIPTHPYLYGRSTSPSPQSAPPEADEEQDENDQGFRFPRDVPVVYPLPPSYSFLSPSLPPSPTGSTDSLSDLAALSFSRRPSVAPSYGSATAESDIVDPFSPGAPGGPRSFIRVVHEEDEDDIVSVAASYPPPGIASRFSDWTPTPPPSEPSLSLEAFPTIEEGAVDEQAWDLDDNLHLASARSFVDLSSSADVEGRYRRVSGGRASASAVDVLAASLGGAKNTLPPSPPALALPPPAEMGKRTSLAEQRSREKMGASWVETGGGAAGGEEKRGKRRECRATFPPATLRRAPMRQGAGAVWWLDDGDARGKGRMSVEAEKRASTGTEPLLGMAG
ncbi:hypothetical protein JCM6882_006690 [Rhodosporidiobolus microsporus]